jgi:hypothetical protein
VTTQHQIEIMLRHVDPPVWRRLLVPSDLQLAEVHRVLMTGMGWAGHHLCESWIVGTTYAEIDDDAADDVVDATSVRLGDLVGPGDRFVFAYDFGDGWEHDVRVEGVVPATGRARATCLDGRRACPPDDVGGPEGYAALLSAIADPDDESHDELLAWVGGSFDPDAFDPVAVSGTLATSSRGRRRR